MTEKTITVLLEQQSDYRFQIFFEEGIPNLISDEPAPLGSGNGPSPLQLLSAAVGNCLSDSLLFSFRKYKQNPDPIHCEVQAHVGRNELGRLRVIKINAKLKLGVSANQLDYIDRVINQFEDFCTVTQSVGQGIPIHVSLIDQNGVTLKE
jgi:uncharacterized OsmC-like protein